MFVSNCVCSCRSKLFAKTMNIQNYAPLIWNALRFRFRINFDVTISSFALSSLNESQSFRWITFLNIKKTFHEYFKRFSQLALSLRTCWRRLLTIIFTAVKASCAPCFHGLSDCWCLNCRCCFVSPLCVRPYILRYFILHVTNCILVIR